MSCALTMKSQRQIKLPYETASEGWKEYTRPYKNCIHLSLNLKERELWTRTAELSGLRVFSCGCYTQAWGHHWERKALDEGVYIYCVAGKGLYRKGGKSWPVEPGELLYCFPNTHHEYKADDNDPWTIYWLHVSGRRIGLFEKHLELKQNKPVIQIGVIPDIVNLFKLMFSFFATMNNDTNKLAIQSCAANILGAMAVAAHSHRATQSYTDEISVAVNFMEESIMKQIDLKDIARQAGVSPFHFSRIFKKATGMSPISYFNQLKIRKACTLLAGSKLKIKEIAYQLGFDDPYYFSRFFKKIMGFPPEQHRHKQAP